MRDIKQADIVADMMGMHPTMKTHRWRQTVTKEFSAIAEDHDGADELQEYLRNQRVIPDGYVIDLENSSLQFFEVEVHSPMSGAKLRTYGKMSVDLPSFGINFSLFAISKHGNVSEIDLLPHYAQWIVAQKEAQ